MFVSRFVCSSVCFLSVFAFGVQAQTFVLGDFDQSEFPQVSVNVFDRNPEEGAEDRWQLFENGVQAPIERISPLKRDPKPHQKALILLENSHFTSFDEQRKYLKDVVLGMIDAFGDQDSLYFTTFNWSYGDGRVIQAENVFVGTKSTIREVIAEVGRPRSMGNKHQATELMTALYEGIRFVEGLELDSLYSKSIWIFSGEMSNLYNSQHTSESIILTARQVDVPIYCIRYPRVGAKYTLEKVARETFGVHYGVRTGSDLTEDVARVQQLVEDAPVRAAGRGYTMTYRSEHPYGKKLVNVTLKKNGEVLTREASFRTPTYFAYIWDAPERIALAVVGLLLSLGGIGFFVFRRMKRRQEEERITAEQEARARDSASREREQQRRELDELRKREDMRTREQEEKRSREELNRLNEESRQRFLALPRAPILVSRAGEQFILGEFTVLGRSSEDGCAWSIQEKTVSKRHAVILFERKSPEGIPEASRSFFIVDLRSTNGTRVNGSVVNEAVELHDGDVVELGAAFFTFRV